MGIASRLIGSTVLLIAIGGISRAGAQITAANLSGIVKDDTGAVLPGVDVTVKNLETGLSRSATTGDDGSYTIPGLPPGRYEARASRPGFATAVQAGIHLAVA